MSGSVVAPVPAIEEPGSRLGHAHLGRSGDQPLRQGLPACVPAHRQQVRRRGPHPGGVRPGLPFAGELQARERWTAGCTGSPRTFSWTRPGARAGSASMPWPRTPSRGCRAGSPGRSKASSSTTWTSMSRPRSRNFPPDFRAAVVLCDLEGLSYDEVAEALGVKLGTVRSRIHRGRTMLREKLAHRDPRRAQAVPQAAAQDAPHRRRSLIGAMGQLRRLLGGSGCRFSAGRGGCAPGNGPPASPPRAPSADCRARQRQRQYLERLRDAAVPAASEELTARLLPDTRNWP